MSVVAAVTAVTKYKVFSRTMCAVPLYELILDNMHPELEPFITSKNALIAAIWQYNPHKAVNFACRHVMTAL